MGPVHGIAVAMEKNSDAYMIAPLEAIVAGVQN